MGVVTSRFNSEITDKLETGALDWIRANVKEDLDIVSLRVPGAVEIPLACKALFDDGCEAVVAVGCVIRGDTSHYDVVCNSVERGVTHLMLEYGRPIGFGVITTENDQQAEDRAGGKLGNKGAEAAEVAFEMMYMLRDLKA